MLKRLGLRCKPLEVKGNASDPGWYDRRLKSCDAEQTSEGTEVDVALDEAVDFEETPVDNIVFSRFEL